MIKKTFSTTTNEITSAQIWTLMADIDNWKTWDSGVEHSELRGRFETGSTFLLKPKGGPKVMIQLLAVEPVTYFKDKTTFLLAKMYGEHWYEETPEGVKITITMTMKGLLAGLWNKIVMKDIVTHLADDVQCQIAAAKKL